MNSGIAEFYSSIGVLCLVITAFLILRGYYIFKNWRSGDKDELWRFLSLSSGGAGTILLGIGLIGIAIAPSPEAFLAWVNVTFVGLILGTVALGLMTYIYYLDWQTNK